MKSIWNYFFNYERPSPPPLIKFGRWDSQLDYLDHTHNNIITKLINLFQEAGTDKYSRYFDGEPILDFALSNNLTDHTADYIYRQYVYHILGKHEDIDPNVEEMKHLVSEFNRGLIE